MLLGVMLFMMSLVFFATGLIAEMMSRIYFESQGKRVYTVREIRHGTSAWRGRPGRPEVPNRG
jgi:hypothetical protein